MLRQRPSIPSLSGVRSPFKLAGLVLLLCAMVVWGACMSPTPGNHRNALTVFAAASLTEAFDQAARAFESEHPSVSVTVHNAGSQQLRTQLVHGARADVFASADLRQMVAVVDSGLVSGQPRDFATNRLVAIVSTDSSSGDEVGLAYLGQPGIKLVLAAPEVPAGTYARGAIERLRNAPELGEGYPERVLGNLVSEETNVRNVVQKVALGEADAGVVYMTDVNSIPAGTVLVVPIPPESDVTIQYPIAVLKGASQPDLARSFVEFMVTGRGQDILSRHGFGRAQTGESTR